MTLSASRDGNRVKVTITYGPVTASVIEEPGHITGFQDNLNRVIEQIKEGAE